MNNDTIKKELVNEIEELRTKINEEFRNNKKLSHPKIVQLSQHLDDKIAKYQKLNKLELSK
jgi:hypothetical protein